MNLTDEILFNEAPCFMSVHDLDGKITKVNKLFLNTFGDRIGDYCYSVYKQHGEKCPSCPMDNVQNLPTIFNHEEIFITPVGEPVRVLVNTAPVYDEKGNPIAIIEMAVDNTETKKLERRFEENYEKYKTLYNEVPCYISVQNKDFRLIDTNRRFREEFGGKTGDFCYCVYKRRDSHCEICPVAKAFEDGRVHTSEEIVASRKGEPVNTLVFAAPLRDISGEIYAVMEMSTDITQVRKMQSNLTNVGQLISGMAHSIKAIITGLEGGMYVVESGFKKNNQDTVQKGWDMVKRNVERVSHFVLDMLYYVKDRIPELQEVDLNKLCNEVCELYRSKLEVHKISANFEQVELGKFRGDPKAIFTLIMTLVENAIDACNWDDKKDLHFINLILIPEKSHVFIHIEDNGSGISEETKSKLFSTMYSTKGSSGTGFGLMVAKKIVDEHGGEISVESELNEGTKFIVKLPR